MRIYINIHIVEVICREEVEYQQPEKKKKL